MKKVYKIMPFPFDKMLLICLSLTCLSYNLQMPNKINPES